MSGFLFHRSGLRVCLVLEGEIEGTLKDHLAIPTSNKDTSLELCVGGRRRRGCFHKDLSRLQDSTLSPCPIRPNPNISTRFQRQASYSITDKNNGVLQPEPQLSGC